MSVQSRTFCCCIPVRFGVFVIALLAFLASSLLAASVWYSIARPGQIKNVNVTGDLKIAFIVVGAFASAVAVASFLGLLGAIFRVRGLVAFYAGFLWLALIANVGIGVYYIIVLVRHFHSDVNFCQNTIKNAVNGNPNGSTPSSNNACISGTAAKIVYIGIFAGELLVLLFGTIIVHRYKRQLEEEEESWNRPGKYLYSAPVPMAHPLGTSGTGYQNTQLGQYQPVAFTGHETYPYAHPEHSYGNH